MSLFMDSSNFFLLAGPCVIEGEDMAMRIADKCVNITSRLDIPYAFKGSFKKANRSRIDSFTGICDEKALKILARVRKEFGIPVVTDIRLSSAVRQTCWLLQHVPARPSISRKVSSLLPMPCSSQPRR